MGAALFGRFRLAEEAVASKAWVVARPFGWVRLCQGLALVGLGLEGRPGVACLFVSLSASEGLARFCLRFGLVGCALLLCFYGWRLVCNGLLWVMRMNFGWEPCLSRFCLVSVGLSGFGMRAHATFMWCGCTGAPCRHPVGSRLLGAIMFILGM